MIRPQTMLKLSLDQRRLLAESLKDAANVGAGVMLFGQALGNTPFSLPLFVGGVLIWLVLTLGAVRLMGKPKP